MRFTPTSFRPVFGRGLSLIVAVIVAAALLGFTLTGDWVGLARYAWTPLLLAALAWTLFWLPRVEVGESEVTVRNVFETVHIPWPAIRRIDTKYALTLYTPLGKTVAWAAPAPGARGTGRVGRTGGGTLPEGGAHPRDALETESGAAAHVIRRHWEDLREAGHLDHAVIEPGTLRRETHWFTIALLAALLLASLLGLVL